MGAEFALKGCLAIFGGEFDFAVEALEDVSADIYNIWFDVGG